MIIISEIKNKKIKIPIDVDDGKYTIQIIPVLLKSSKEFQAMYFLMVDIVRNYSGWTRYEIHEAFKVYSEIATTKNFGEDDWSIYIDRFRYWVFNNFDIAI